MSNVIGRSKGKHATCFYLQLQYLTFKSKVIHNAQKQIKIIKIHLLHIHLHVYAKIRFFYLHNYYCMLIMPQNILCVFHLQTYFTSITCTKQSLITNLDQKNLLKIVLNASTYSLSFVAVINSKLFSVTRFLLFFLIDNQVVRPDIYATIV